MAKRPPSTRGTNVEASRAGTAEQDGMGTIPLQTTIDPDSIITIDDEDPDVGFD